MDIFSDKWDQQRADNLSVDTMRQIATEVMQLGEDDEALYIYAAEHKLTVNQVVYYFNAYQYGGDSGLQAIHNPDIIPPDVAQGAIKTISKMLDDYFEGRLPYRLTDEGTAIGIYEIQQRMNGDKYLFAICQLRLMMADNRWHLYWMRKFDAWWPYSPPSTGRKYSLRARVQQVLEDEYGCFWG